LGFHQEFDESCFVWWRQQERAVEPFALAKVVVSGTREREGLNTSLLLILLIMPEVMGVDVLDWIYMLLTGGLATLPVRDLDMATHAFSLLLSCSTRHHLFDSSFCIFLYCASSSL
jgi:hypothetical protein